MISIRQRRVQGFGFRAPGPCSKSLPVLASTYHIMGVFNTRGRLILVGEDDKDYPKEKI